jgi:hypothetical protein
MKRIILILVVIFAAARPAAFAQPSSGYTPNGVYFEFLGQGLLYSVNFDHRFAENIAVRAGFSHFTIGFISDVTITTIPLMVEYLSGTGNHHLEIGVGAVPIYGRISGDFFGSGGGTAGAWVVVATATVGYRYQPVREGLLFRIGLTPFFMNVGALMFGGASIGYAF